MTERDHIESTAYNLFCKHMAEHGSAGSIEGWEALTPQAKREYRRRAKAFRRQWKRDHP